VDPLGNVDTSTVITDGYVGGTIRGAASPDGQSIWTSGSNSGGSGGLRFTSFGSTGATTQISTTATDVSAVEIFNNQLMVSVSSLAAIRIGNVGTGLPTTNGQTIANLPGLTSTLLTKPYEFFLADLNPNVPGPDVLYVADEDNNVGLRKFSLVNGSWSINGSIVLDGRGVRGLTGNVANGVVTIFATNTETTENKIWKVVDGSGWNQTLVGGQVISTGIANEAYRGIAFVPELRRFDFQAVPQNVWGIVAAGFIADGG
jgi:hypothetical protein